MQQISQFLPQYLPWHIISGVTEYVRGLGACTKHFNFGTPSQMQVQGLHPVDGFYFFFFFFPHQPAALAALMKAETAACSGCKYTSLWSP